MQTQQPQDHDDPRDVINRIDSLPADKIGNAIARVIRRGVAVAGVALVIALASSSADAPPLVQGIAWTLAGVAVGALIGWTGGTMFRQIGPAVIPQWLPVVDELGRMPLQSPIQRSDCPPCPVCEARPFETCVVDGAILLPPHPQREQVAELAGWRPPAPVTRQILAELQAAADGARHSANSLDALARDVQRGAPE